MTWRTRLRASQRANIRASKSERPTAPASGCSQVSRKASAAPAAESTNRRRINQTLLCERSSIETNLTSETPVATAGLGSILGSTVLDR